MHAPPDLLARLADAPPARLLVVGKGGVGKTTVAAAVACAAAARGTRCDVVSVDPAHSLGDALDVSLLAAPLAVRGPEGPDAGPSGALPGLRAAELDPRAIVREWIALNRPALRTLLAEGSLLDDAEVASLLEGNWPGLDELAALLFLAARGRDAAPLVVDTAPTGHALRLLDAPSLAEGWIETLEAMNRRRRGVREVFAAVAEDGTDRLVATLRDDVRRVRAQLADARGTRALVVTNDEPVALAETERLRLELARRGVPLAGIVVNRVRADGVIDAARELVARWESEGVAVATRARLGLPPRGVEALVAFARGGGAGTDDVAPPQGATRSDTTTGGLEQEAADDPARVASLLAAPDARLHVVLGKGGVGKTTVASALALVLADRKPGARVLLVSVDPAGSLGDVWGAEVEDGPAPAPGAEAIRLRQPDVAALWADFRDEAAGEVARILAALDERHLAGADGEVVASLLRLSPPGMDELMGVLALIAGTADADYDFIVVDTAPTGHALRLLDTPERAGAWVHSTMRVLLRLRPLVGLGPFAERLVRLSRELREFDSLLHDPHRTHLVVVTRPEPLVLAETARLRGALRARGRRSVTMLVNAWDERPEESGAPLDDVRVVAARESAGPRGADGLRRFASRWRSPATPAPGAPARG